MLLGISFSFVAFLILFIDASEGACIAVDVLYHTAFTLTFSSVLVKTWVLFCLSSHLLFRDLQKFGIQKRGMLDLMYAQNC
jgi:hypothetical protein